MAEYHHSNRNRHNSDSDGNSIVPVHTAGTAATAKTASDGSLPSGPTLGPSDTLEPLNPFDTGVQMHNGKRVLGEEDAYNQLAHAWPLRKKWLLLTVVAVCQTSMNFNAAIYSNAVGPINEHFHVDNARVGMVAFLVAYAFGCELWAPWSEELGRWSVMQMSLSLVNISILICALSTSFPMMIAGRVIGGLSSAGGSVTLGMVADMFGPDEQQHAVLWASLWSCLGAVIGGICGGPIQQYLHWRYLFWVQLMFSCATQLLHLLVAKESRATTLLDKEAKRRRKTRRDLTIYGPNEVKTAKERWVPKEILKTMWRPYHMLITEPIVLFLSLLSGFADALIFMFFESYGIVFKQWGFSPTQISLVLVTLAVSYFLAYFSFFPVIKRHNKKRADNEILSPETRLWWLLYLVILLPVGLLISAFVGTVSWIGVVVATIPIGIANYAIYYATIDYMVAAYGVYSASATGGNGFCRDFLAGMCAIYTKPMFNRLGIQKTYFLLFGLAFALCIPVYVFYLKGSAIRKRSRFAEQLAAKNEKKGAVKEALARQNSMPKSMEA